MLKSPTCSRWSYGLPEVPGRISGANRSGSIGRLSSESVAGVRPDSRPVRTQIRLGILQQAPQFGGVTAGAGIPHGGREPERPKLHVPGLQRFGGESIGASMPRQSWDGNGQQTVVTGEPQLHV